MRSSVECHAAKSKAGSGSVGAGATRKRGCPPTIAPGDSRAAGSDDAAPVGDGCVPRRRGRRMTTAVPSGGSGLSGRPAPPRELGLEKGGGKGRFAVPAADLGR